MTASIRDQARAGSLPLPQLVKLWGEIQPDALHSAKRISGSGSGLPGVNIRATSSFWRSVSPNSAFAKASALP